MSTKMQGIIGISVVLVCVVIAAVVAVVAVLGGSGPSVSGLFGGSSPSTAAREDIPPDRLALYQQAARVCPGLDWSVLAGIGKVETDHGRSALPGVASGENSAGAGGPMQFLQSTFDSVVTRHPLPPGGANPPSRYDPHDAIYAAAFDLCDNGAPRDLHGAIFSYNHADWYVQEVLDQAHRYALTPPSETADCQHIQAPTRAAVIAIAYACAQLGQPYVWGGNGPTVNGGWDCSGLTSAAYRAAGIALPRTAQEQYYTGPPIPEDQLQPGDLVYYGNAQNIHHVGLYLGRGKIINAPDYNIPVRVANARYKDDDYYGATRPSALTTSKAENPVERP